MNSYNELITLIDAVINRNGVQAITGQVLNGVLKAMVQQLGAGYSLSGVAHPTDDPGTPEQPVCYFASEVGTYTNFGGVGIVAGELALLCYDMTDGWFKETMYEGFASVGATIDGNVGTPSVDVTYNNGILSFDFRNLKGNPGEDGNDGQDGAAAGFGSISASVDANVGTPSVAVTESGPDTAKNLAFAFHNLKGADGDPGVTSVNVTVDNTSGSPACAVSLNAGVLTLAFTGLKGAQGDTGSSVAYPFTIVNNLTTDDATQALSAAQGVVLEGEISQLEAEVDEIDEYLEGNRVFNNAVVGSGGVITFTPITLSENGDAIEFCTIREATTDSNVGNAFLTNNGAGAVTVRDGVVGVRNSQGTWMTNFNAGSGQVSVGDTYTGARSYRLAVEDGNLVLYQTYNGETTLKASTPISTNVIQFDALCGSFNGTEWVGTLKKFIYTHNGVSKDVTMLDGFSTTGDVTLNYDTQEGAKDKIAEIDTIKADIVALGVTVGTKASKTELEAVNNKFLAEKQLLYFPVNVGKVSRDDGSITESTPYRYVTINLTGKGYKAMRYNAGASDNNTVNGFWLDDDTWVGAAYDGGIAGMHTVAVPSNAKTFVVSWSVNYLAENAQTLFASSLQTMQDAYDAMKVKEAHLPIRFTHNLSAVPAQTATPQSDYGNLANLYSLYDGLMQANPAYISKEECTVDGVAKPSYLEGMNIYIYKFIPKAQSTSASLKPTLKVPKVMIFTGTHSDEYMGHYTVFNMMKMFCEKWSTIADCSTLRTQVEFYIVPCLNPYGFVNHSRFNGNGVDLNRNFPASDWKSGSTSGSEAGSEYETKVAMKYIQEVSPDVLMDCHTGNMGAGGINGSFNVLRYNQELADAAQIACKRTVSQWIGENENFGGNPDIVLINEGYWGATGELFVWAGENIQSCLATLTEQSIENKWENGVYESGNTGEVLTNRIHREQLQYIYECFMQLVETAAMRI